MNNWEKGDKIRNKSTLKMVVRVEGDNENKL